MLFSVRMLGRFRNCRRNRPSSLHSRLRPRGRQTPLIRFFKCQCGRRNWGAGSFSSAAIEEMPGVRKTGWRTDQRSEGGDVSELRVEPASLETAAGHSDEAAQSSANLNIKDGMEGVSTAMKGGVSGPVAKSAANQVDSISKKMSQSLNAFTDALRSAKEAYIQTDDSTKVDFTRFESAVEGEDQ